MRRSSHTLMLTAAITAVILTAEHSSEAASRLNVDFAELLKTADAVVQARVIAQRVSENKDGMVITVVTLRLERVYKGELARDAIIETAYLGGTVASRMDVVPGQPDLATNQNVVLFLTGGGSSVNWTILGGDAGQITLQPAARDQSVARRGSGRFEFYVADTASITGYRAVKSETIYSTQLETLLRAVVETGRPVIEAPQATNELPPQHAAVRSADQSEPSYFWRVMLVALLAGAALLNARQARHRVRK